MPITHLKIGTRGSILALIQAQLVADALTAIQPGLEIETVIIKTEGDQNQAPIPLDTVGKAWFTAEIDRALVAGDIDLAVHSLKDLPLELGPDLALAITLERADPRDALISKSGRNFSELAPGSVVGTDSLRRGALVRHLRPDLTVRSLRGNVQTRLRKLHQPNYDAIVLAAAGLERLGQAGIITELLDPTEFIPAIGQGILGVEVRAKDADLHALLGKIEHAPTVAMATAERAFSAAIGGGCKLPVGCYAELRAKTIHVHGMIGELDGAEIMFRSASGPVREAQTLARELAAAMLGDCTFEFKPEPQPEHA